MRWKYARAALVMALAVPAARGEAGTLAAQDEPWIHVRVVESKPGGSDVEVNLPFSMIGAALAVVPEDVMVNGELAIDSSDVSVAEMRRMWQQLRAAGDADFVTLEEQDRRVQISRKGSAVLVQVENPEDGGEEVRIEMPVRMVDALFSGKGEGLNVGAALAQLETVRGEILTVRDKDQHVRIWIDERSASAR